MDVESLIIESHSDTGRATRSFRASLLNLVVMPALMGYEDRGPMLPVRPAMLSFVASDAECRAFAANARTGRVIECQNKYGNMEFDVELLKSDGYRAAVSKMADCATAITLFSPKVFALEARPSDTVAFGMAVPIHWVDGMAKSLAAAGGLGKIPPREAAVAMWFVAYLDRRCRTPLLATPEFSWRLWQAAKSDKLARPAASGTDRKRVAAWVNPDPPYGLEVVAAVHCVTDQIESWIAEETKSYMRKGGRAAVDVLLREAEERVRVQEAQLAAAREQEEEEWAQVRETMPVRTGGRGTDGTTGERSAGRVLPAAGVVCEQVGLFGEVAL